MERWDILIRGNEWDVETLTQRASTSRGQMLTLHVGCQFDFDAQLEVPAICLVRPGGFDGVRLMSESWMTTPPVSYHDYADVYGNVCRRLTLPAGLVTIYYDARVEAPNDAEAV